MHGPSKNKMAGVNSCFASVFEMEIPRLQCCTRKYKGLIKGIDQHSIADVFSTHDPPFSMSVLLNFRQLYRRTLGTPRASGGGHEKLL